MQFIFGHFQFFVECFEVSCNRAGIQWHVNDRCYTSSCSRLCCSIKSFPISSPGFIDMNMCIYYTGH